MVRELNPAVSDSETGKAECRACVDNDETLEYHLFRWPSSPPVEIGHFRRYPIKNILDR